MKTTASKAAPALTWINDLYEVGTLTHFVRDEQEKLDRRAELLRQLAAVDADLAALRKRAMSETLECYTAAEVKQAQALAKVAA